jgi:hypothetical protein
MVILNASDPDTAKKMNDIIKNAKHVFILVYMVGCGPCNATRPEWKKMCNELNNEYSSRNDVAILDLDNKFMNEVKRIGDVNGFPTIKYISEQGNKSEAYENSKIPNLKRSSDSFIKWIKSKMSKNNKIKSGGSPSPSSSSSLSVFDLSESISSKQRHSAKTVRNYSPFSKKKKGIMTSRRKLIKRTKRTKKNQRNQKRQKRQRNSVGRQR